ncbi:MAG: tRNA (adenosine(37)-N6)-dimethylallyltransferase MiaA [Clostridiales Family XIII bacterium]|jgi:tRNA dimethylallyltransferase|nr:tRNA (adenosine(37)-N6)-dimethylallyltransferase MiaA [Clostridiales Family XIII bacterium]
MGHNAIIIMGPTAVGKTDIALTVAESLGGEIVSADSMQIYRGLDIGTAKPSREQLARVPHHMIDVADPKKPYSAWEYRSGAGAAIEGIFARGRVPVIAGGTGLYIHSLVYDMDFGGSAGDAALRRKYERLADERGAEYLHGLLAERDPAAAERIHPNNVKRVIRALERMPASAAVADGKTHSTGGYAPFRFELRRGGLIDPVLVLLTRERAGLVKRIELRVDEMLGGGLVSEVEGLVAKGLSLEQISMLGIGYKEVLGYIGGEYGYDEMAELIKIHSRRYAKRQMTWFKRYKDATAINLSEVGETGAAEIITGLFTEQIAL